jgi:hypothetical protein
VCVVCHTNAADACRAVCVCVRVSRARASRPRSPWRSSSRSRATTCKGRTPHLRNIVNRLVPRRPHTHTHARACVCVCVCGVMGGTSIGEEGAGGEEEVAVGELERVHGRLLRREGLQQLRRPGATSPPRQQCARSTSGVGEEGTW